MLVTASRSLLVLPILAFGVAATAQAQICLNGFVTTQVSTGMGDNTLVDHQTLGNPGVCQPQAVSGTLRSNQNYDIGGISPGGHQAADASLYGYASYGGLRAAVSGETSVGDVVNNSTSAGGNLEEIWRDVITFHTANALGTDFNFSITLDDSVGAALLQGPGYARNSFASALVLTNLFIGGADPLLSIIDQQDVRISNAPSPATPISVDNHPGQRTVSAVVHVIDGQQLHLEQTLLVQASLNGGGNAFADAGDTAYFNLSTSDASASYTTASGTVFPASGDPFAAVSPVPEPSEFVLMAGGLGAIGSMVKRRRRHSVVAPYPA